MFIKITQKYGEKQNISLIERSCNTLYKKLFTPTQRLNVKNIRVILKKFKNKTVGECIYVKDANNQFYIQINVDRTEPIDELITIIAHEMIHAKQCVDGRLVFNGKRWTWKGKDFGTNPYKNLTQKEQRNQLPWEAEAYSKSIPLAQSIFNNIRLNKY